MPSSEVPACTITGRPCGGRGTFSGPRTGVVLPLVIEEMHLVRSKNMPLSLVAHEGVVIPAVPQPGDHLDELVGALVALGVRIVARRG